MPDAPTDRAALVILADVGDHARAFLSQPLGVYVTQRAHDEITEALNALANADPGDAGTIRELQGRIQIAAGILAWLDDAIVQGEMAVRMLDDPG